MATVPQDELRGTGQMTGHGTAYAARSRDGMAATAAPVLN